MADDIDVFFEDFDNYAYEVSQARHQDFADRLKHWLEILNNAPEPLKSHIVSLQNLFPPERIDREVLQDRGGMAGSGRLRWPDGIDERLSAQLALLTRLIEDENKGWQFAHHYYPGGGTNLDSIMHQLTA